MDLESTIIGLVAGLLVGWLRTSGVATQWKRRVMALAHAIDREFGNSTTSVKANVRAGPLGDDVKLNTMLDEVSPRVEPRVSLGRKILDAALDAVPLLSLFRK